MFTFVMQVAEPVVGPDTQHQDCACVGLVVAVPEGVLNLFADNADALEQLGWGILAEAEKLKRAEPPAAGAHSHA